MKKFIFDVDGTLTPAHKKSTMTLLYFSQHSAPRMMYILLQEVIEIKL